VIPAGDATTPRIVVIGAGIGGLTAAYRLAQRRPGAAITVLDAAARPGGVIASSLREGCLIEHGPDSIVSIKPAGLALVRDLGLADLLIGTEPDARSSLIAVGDRLVPVPEGLYLMAPGKILPFLRSPLLSWPGKLRMAWDFSLPRRDPAYGDESLAAFVRRRLGREALDRIAQPMVSGIYTADPEQLSVAATMPQFLDMERTHGSLIRAMMERSRAAAGAGAGQATGPRYGLFVSLRGGLQVLIDRLVAVLGERGVAIRTACPARSLARAGTGFTITTAGGVHRARSRLGRSVDALVDDDGTETLACDQVVVATQLDAAAGLLAGLDGELAQLARAVPYAGVATVNLAFDAGQAPDLPAAAGFVVPACERRGIIACTLAHRKYGGRCPPGTVLLRAFVGGALHEDRLDLSDSALIAIIMRDLRTYCGIRGEPRWTEIHRWPKAMAQYVTADGGHLARTAALRRRERAIPGLAIVSNGCEGVGIPDLAAQALSAAERLAP
jgi:oxygen-dependent protoporphyrinogen oxidase